MESNDTEKDSSRIMAVIKERAVRIRPKWHFILQAGLFLIGTIILVVALLYVGSFIYFTLHRTGLYVAPQYGFRGWFIFFRSLPWTLIFLSLAFLLLLELLVRHYSFAYRRPLLYSLLGILVVVLLGSLLIYQTSLHQRLQRSADTDALPFAGPLYRAYGRPRIPEVSMGTVTDLIQNGLHMQERGGGVLSVMITPRTRIPMGPPIIIGDHIVVFGDRVDDTIKAMGIHKVVDFDWDR